MSIFESFRRKAIVLAQRSDGAFGSVCDPFLSLMYSELNSHRRKGLVPEGEYRQKGNVFRDMIIELVKKRTGIQLKDKKINGFTEIHDIDIVPVNIDILKVAAEVKMLGTPEHKLKSGEDKPERAGHVDIDKRLKEVKFTAVDLKLQYGGTNVGAWDDWIRTARPAFYSIWGCMIGSSTPNKANLLTRKFVDLRKYNNGVGVLFYTEQKGGYVQISKTLDLDIDNVIDAICNDLSR